MSPDLRVPSTQKETGKADLGNAGVAAAGALLARVHPVGLGGRAVGPQLTPVLRDAPAAVEARISLEAEAAARPLRPALIQENCRQNALLGGSCREPGARRTPRKGPPCRTWPQLMATVPPEVSSSAPSHPSPRKVAGLSMGKSPSHTTEKSSSVSPYSSPS